MDGTNGVPQGAPQGFPGGPGGFPGGRPPGGPGGGMMLFGPWGGIVALTLLVLTYVVLAVAFWQFLKKAGLTPAVALLMLVPVVNLGVALWAAFSEWPVLREVERLRLVAASADLIAGSAPLELQRGAQPMPGTTAS
jgi:hypothetical protein